KVLVHCIAMIDNATAKGAVRYIISGQILTILTPIKADIICPPIRFLGWASGLSIAPYISTQVAPKEPIRYTFSKRENCASCINPIINKPINAPLNDQNFSFGFTSVSLYMIYLLSLILLDCSF